MAVKSQSKRTLYEIATERSLKGGGGSDKNINTTQNAWKSGRKNRVETVNFLNL